MTKYNTYQEAKIAMPKACICVYKNNGKDVFIGMPSREGTTLFNGSEFAEPQDYCMTVEKFLVDGHEVFMGDAIININGNVNYITKGDAKVINSEGGATFNNARYILRAAALEDIPTETPEEKEVLDGIESAGEVEWKDKDELPPVGWRGLTAYTEEGCDDWCDFHDGVVMGVNGDCVWVAHHGKFQRVHHIGSIEFQDVETPQQRKDRERACAIYDMCAEADIFTEESNFWAGKFYDLGYKKEKTHGTN